MLTVDEREPLARALFTPRRIALVGASDDPGRAGGVLWQNLRSFPGEVVPVSRSRATLDGRRAFSSLRDVPGEVDMVVVAVPAANVVDVVRDAAAQRVRVAVVVSGGFAEIGPEGARLQDELRATARAGGVRLVGPNCLGVADCDIPLNASLAAGLPTGGGGISLVVQSGAYGMAMHALAADEGVRFAKLCSTGNKADVDDADLLRLLRDDPATRVVCVLAESLPDGRRFFEELRRTTRSKPVVVALTGRTEAGARAAQSHTAALAGCGAVRSGALAQTGAVEVRTGVEMLDVARMLAATPRAVGPRVGIVTNSGGTAVEIADLLVDLGLHVPPLSPALETQLAEVLPAHASPRNPVDLTPVWQRFADLYPFAVERLARSGEVDAVVVVLVHRAAADSAAVEALVGAAQRLRRDGVQVALCACTVAPSTALPNVRRLSAAGIPCYPWPERAARALAAAVPRDLLLRSRPLVGRSARAERFLDPEEAAWRLSDAGVPLVAHAVCDDPDAAASAAADLRPPYVVKLCQADVVHKTEVGGVRLHLATPQDVRSAAADLLAVRADARVLVQQQLVGVELVVGALRDPEFGPAVMVGLGGVHVELFDDVAWLVAPVDEHDVRHALARLRAHPALTGFRGATAVDVAAVAALARSLGQLLLRKPDVMAVDLNPVLSGPAGTHAVDWRLAVCDT